MEVRLQPFVCFLRRLLDLIQSRDTGDIFSEPVDLSEVPDYSDVVTQPMDISTMRSKLENFQYSNLDAFEKDFNLMISNCMAYNSRDTIFYRAAIKMRDQVSQICNMFSWNFGWSLMWEDCLFSCYLTECFSC